MGTVVDKQTGKPRPAKGNVRVDPTLDLIVSASTDDCLCYWNGSAWVFPALTTTYVPAGYYSATGYKLGGGMRFAGVTIPQGATIDTAYFTIVADYDFTVDTVNTRITGNDVDDAATWSDLADYQARRGTIVGGANDDYITSAQVDWDAIEHFAVGTPYNSPEIKTIIQEIINRASWASGNALVLWWDDYDDRSTHIAVAQRQGASYDHETYDPPKLHIEYTPALPAVGRSFGFIIG